MQNAKDGKITASRNGTIFSYLVEIGKLKFRNILRKKKPELTDDSVTKSRDKHNSNEGDLTTEEEKQQMQNDFLDKVIELLPSECKSLLKLFYWDHKPMDEIASILGMRNADSAKSKKSKCMNKVRDIAMQLFESDEFAEDAIRNAVERAALKELIAEEMTYADSGFCMAALDVENESKE